MVTALQSNNSDSDERKAYFVINASRWRILMTIRQQIVDISGRTINMVSFRSYLGHLGENLLLPNISPESRGAGMIDFSNFYQLIAKSPLSHWLAVLSFVEALICC